MDRRIYLFIYLVIPILEYARIRVCHVLKKVAIHRMCSILLPIVPKPEIVLQLANTSYV